MTREIRRRTRVVGAFPDGNSALMLVCARLHHVAGTQWDGKRYMNMKHLDALEDELQAGCSSQGAKRQGQDERRTAALDPLRPAR